MKTIAIAIACLALAGCSVASQRLDETTGTTKAQRCADYQGFLAGALAVQAQSPSEDRAARIAYYRAFILANCPEVSQN